MGGVYWIASYPKSGNTWFRVLLGNLCSGSVTTGVNALDTPIASSRAWLDATLGFDTGDLDLDEIDRLRPVVYDWSQNDQAVTYHKTHDAYSRLPDGRPLLGTTRTLGAVYIMRNPLDIVASYAAHGGLTIDRAIALMGDPDHSHNGHTDRLATQVRQKFLHWSGHVESWVDADAFPVSVVRYEDMTADGEATLARAARFLGLPDDPARISEAVRDSGFDLLAARERSDGFVERPPGMPAFFREGRVGSWKDRLEDRQVVQVISDHGSMMQRFHYLDARGNPA